LTEFEVEDFGTFRRLHAKGPHTHEAKKGAGICEECYVDLPFSSTFLRELTDWDPHGVFHFIAERLCNDAFNEAARNAVDRFCGDLTGASVLDFGSGFGQLSPFFFERGAREVTLAEIDDRILALSRTYMEDGGYGGRSRFLLIRESDGLSEIEERSLDLIVASEVFEHVLPRYRADTLRALFSKLKSGGIIILTAPNRLFPKDTHTTGLWFAAWLPPSIGARYALKCASWRWKNRSTEELLRQGLRQYSYFEARKVLKPLGAEDLCAKYPAEHEGATEPRSLRAHAFYKTLNLLFALLLRQLGPWEAWQPTLVTAWSRPR
jgi:2-polyprenyl-3-methyl-5-hydroxy-6-metoxy-1,4-benzoquinol methylase